MNIPTYVDIPVVDPKTGMFTAQWKVIMQTLFASLVTGASEQGLVAPTQVAADVTIIQNNQIPNPAPPPAPVSIYTCQYGTLLYNSTANSLMVALNNAGVPQFYTVVTI